jgi:Protein of unknown function (DUF1997)
MYTSVVVASKPSCRTGRCCSPRAASGADASGITRSYASRRSLRVSLREDTEFNTRRFLQHTDRVVLLAFPDASRRTRVAHDAWCVQLLPFQLLWWTVQASCTLRTWNEASTGALKLSGRELHIAGLPTELGACCGSLGACCGRVSRGV